MKFSKKQKEKIKKQIRNILSNEVEIQKIIIFGSFSNSNDPHDIDIAVFQNSREHYLDLSMKYRKLMRELINIINTFAIKQPFFVHEFVLTREFS
jgi:predicted nucleotidyltransferase